MGRNLHWSIILASEDQHPAGRRQMIDSLQAAVAANIDDLAAPASCHVVRVGVSGETLMSGIRRE